MKISITIGPDSVTASAPCAKCERKVGKVLTVPKSFRVMYAMTRGLLEIPRKEAAVYDYELEGALLCRHCLGE